MFVHGGPIHLLGNMYFLYTFGDNVEDILGAMRFGALYMLCGVLGGLGHFVSDPVSTVPAVGASGAISGVLGAYMFLSPRQKIQMTIFGWFPVRLWAVWYFVFWLFLQLWRAFAVDAGVAVFGHLGEFLAGLLLIQGLSSGRQAVRPSKAVLRHRWVRARPNAKTPGGPMSCPICGLVSPPTAEWCDCGYDFKPAE
jgi:membrane associated rhomboid family serine protease